ncbi:MAG: hypothetical protein HY830_17120 [Actinobacteria bacterium]|nr:hypothetical protein [Actinomycetota bacterium]
MSAQPVEDDDLLRRLRHKQASIAEIRSALVPEEIAEFDEGWAGLLAEATRTHDLEPVLTFVEGYRTHALLAVHLGATGYRDMLARAEETLRLAEAGELVRDTWDWKADLRSRGADV